MITSNSKKFDIYIMKQEKMIMRLAVYMVESNGRKLTADNICNEYDKLSAEYKSSDDELNLSWGFSLTDYYKAEEKRKSGN